METGWHRYELNLLVEQIRYRFLDKRDHFVGGKMFIFFSAEQELSVYAALK